MLNVVSLLIKVFDGIRDHPWRAGTGPGGWIPPLRHRDGEWGLVYGLWSNCPVGRLCLAQTMRMKVT